MVDEAQISWQVQQRDEQVSIHESWRTPSGRLRNTAMFEAHITNEYLVKSRVIKGQDRHVLMDKVKDQLHRWQQQEIKARVREAKADAKGAAQDSCAEAAEEAKALTLAIENILHATLEIDDRIEWTALLDRQSYPTFAFSVPKPGEPSGPWEPSYRQASFFEFLMPWVKRKRVAQNDDLKEAYETECRRLEAQHAIEVQEWQKALANARVEHDRLGREYDARQRQRNARVHTFKKQFENGEADAIIEYLDKVFERSEYPDRFHVEHSVTYDKQTQTAVVDLVLPALADYPTVADYKFVARSLECRPVKLKQKQREASYDSALKQTVLRTAHEVFESVYTPHVSTCVVNGWVTSIEKATGNDTTSCIISLSVDRTEFEEINLSRVDPSDCLRKLKGLVAGPLAQLAPVRPLLSLVREDDRFIESREVLADMSSHTNLAEMSWQDFEHLIRELFAQMFSDDGMEVRVTQSSSDGGVDAVAFDPDPIRGGKFVIQAKRYTKNVPVAAVRELYGTMINEGATKGILATTAHFGRAARTFAKDKPLTLINGANLLNLLAQHGHKARIDVVEARARRQAVQHPQ